MSKLKKRLDWVITQEYKPGQPGQAGVPPRDGYWSYRTVKSKVPIEPVTPLAPSAAWEFSGTSGGGENTISSDIIIERLSMTYLRAYADRFAPVLVGILDDIQDAYDDGDGDAPEGSAEAVALGNLWDQFRAETSKILNAEVATGQLGRKLCDLSYTWGENAYIAAWDSGDGVWFHSFQGVEPGEEPVQYIVR